MCALALAVNIAWAELPTITVEAESYTEVTGGTVRVLSREAASGGKCVSYWEEPGVAVTVGFEVAEAGDYCLTLKYSLNWDDTRRSVALDGEIVPGLEDVTLPGTGGWDYFSAITVAGPDGDRVRLSLTPGAHTLTLTNVDSRGLGWDAALLHDPALPLADYLLSQGELEELSTLLGPGVYPMLIEGTPDPDLSFGRVSVAFREQGLPRAFRVRDVAFLMPDVPWPAETELVTRFGPLALRLESLETNAARPCVHILTISDGACAYVVVVATSDMQRFFLASPTIAWRDGAPWRLAPKGWQGPPGARTPEGVRSFDVDDVTLSATGDLAGLDEDEEGKYPYYLMFETTWTGAVCAGGLKIGPSISPGDSAIFAEVVGDEVVIRSSREMWPALAAFYGLVQFEWLVHADGSMTITCAGEELTLPAP